MEQKTLRLNLVATFVACLLTTVMLSCSDDKEDSVVDDETPEEEEVQAPDMPTTDQLTVTSSNTLYIQGNILSEKTSGKDVLITHLIDRFQNQQAISDTISIEGMKEGDYMLLCQASSDNVDYTPAVLAAIKKFVEKGGILMFAETSSDNIYKILNDKLELGWTVQEDDDANTDILHVYYQPSSLPTLYASHYEDFDDDQAETVTDYTLGTIADAVLEETSGWISTTRAVSFAKRISRAGDGLKDINALASSLFVHEHKEYNFTNNDYQGKNMAGKNGLTDKFDTSINVWVVKSDADYRYIYTEISSNLSFGNAVVKQYIHTRKGKVYKVNEWWGHDYAWDMTVSGVEDSSKVYVQEHNPKTTEINTTYTSGVSWSFGGSGTVGCSQKDGFSGSASANVGLSISSTRSWTVPDVSYADNTGSAGSGYVGGQFNLKESTAHYSFLAKAMVGVTDGAQVSHTTFSPNTAVLFVIDKEEKNKDKLKLIYNYTVDMVSYQAWCNGSSGKMDIVIKPCKGTKTIDLSGIKFTNSSSGK